MALKDLERFLGKVEQLQQMVSSLDQFPGRRELLSSCSDHNQVVQLARSWGYEIGQRWGEYDYDQPPPNDNLLSRPLPPVGHVRKYRIQEGYGWRLELITSCGVCNNENFWYDQSEHKWILVLRGSASLALKNPYSQVNLNVGDHIFLAAHRLHRVERTDPKPGTICLALSWKETK